MTISGNFLERLLFASLVTYLATQAHGWAGGVATPYWFTVITWMLVSILSLRTKSHSLLLLLSIGVQLAIHFGSMHSHVHEMNTSNTAMVVGHTVAGLAAWAITVFGEDRFSALDKALSLFKFRILYLRQLKTFYWAIKSFNSLDLVIILGSRAPPTLSSY